MKKRKSYYKKFDRKYPATRKEFQDILQFFLFECPTPKTSCRAKTFSQLGWEGSTQFSQLKKKMLEAATDSLRSNYYPCKKAELQEHFEKVKTVSPVNEYCVFLEHDCKTVMQSLFSAIRNAFAHGSFGVQSFSGIRIYFFANYDNYLKAEIILQENTLLKWIKIVKSGYKGNK